MMSEFRYNHISFEMNDKNVAVIKIASNATPCPEGEIIKVKRLKFCLCQRQPIPLSGIKVLKNSLKELTIDPVNPVHISYLYGLVLRRIFKEQNSELLSIELFVKNSVLAYYICKFLKLEMRVPLRVFQDEVEASEGQGVDNYQALAQLIKQFVRNSDSLKTPLGRYPGYLGESNEISQHHKTYGGNGHLTVIIPSALRSERMLLETLKSLEVSKGIIHQLILVVPESSELSTEIEILLKNFISVEILKGSQRGVGFARRLGVESATNQYIAFIDDDDIVDSSYLAKLLEAHKNIDNLAAAGTWLKSFGYSRVMIPQFDNLPIFGILACLPPAGVLMWNREALEALGNFSEEFDRGFEDFYLTSKACSLNHQIAVLDLPLYNYRRHRNSTSARYTLDFESRMRDKILKERLLDSPETTFEIARTLFRNDSSLYDLSPFYWKKVKDINRVRNNHLIRFIYEKFPYKVRKILQRMLRANK